jgi:hypothetical protein
MRTIEFFPMVHVSRESQLPPTISLAKSLSERGIINDEEKSLLELFGSMNTHNLYWNEVREKLLKRPTYQKFYLEAQGNSLYPDIDPESSMGKCIKEIIDRGAELLETESDWWKLLSGMRLSYFTRKREQAVARNIDRSLKEGERALLLFGADHYRTLSDYILDKNIEVVKLFEDA